LWNCSFFKESLLQSFTKPKTSDEASTICLFCKILHGRNLNLQGQEKKQHSVLSLQTSFDFEFDISSRLQKAESEAVSFHRELETQHQRRRKGKWGSGKGLER